MDSDKEFIKHYQELLHEIKSPLDIIRAHALYIKNNTNKIENLEEYLDIILSEAERLDSFLREVGDSIKKVKLSLSLCDINRIIEDVAKKLRHDFDKKGVTLKCNLKKGLPENYVDCNKIYRALINLINNALYSVERGGIVEISTDMNESFCIKVKDNGCGIKKGDNEKIFQPFYTTKPEGTGLGLYIVKNIISAHGGSINVSSEENKGAEFLIILPIVKKRVDNG